MTGYHPLPNNREPPAPSGLGVLHCKGHGGGGRENDTRVRGLARLHLYTIIEKRGQESRRHRPAWECYPVW
jgi:hypothetical protein